MNRYIITLFVLCFLGKTSFSQNFAINLRANIVGQPTPYIMDYATNNKLNIQATFSDPTTTSIQIELKFRFVSASGQAIFNPPTYRQSAPITLTQFMTTPIWGNQFQENLNFYSLAFSGIDANLFQQKRTLPEGTFTIEIQAYKYGTDIQVSNAATIPGVWISENNPPMLIIPRNNDAISYMNPQNIIFSWAPLHIDAPGSFTDYKLELWEVIQGRNPNEVVLNTNPKWQKTLMGQLTFNYGAIETPLDTGRVYAWRVTAVDRDGKGFFKDHGRSQVWVFSYLSPAAMPYLEAPLGFKAEELEASSARIMWDESPHYSSYNLKFRKKGTSKWYDMQIKNGTSQYLKNLEENTEYETQIQGTRGMVSGKYGNNVVFKTKSAVVLKCGEDPIVAARPRLDPLASAAVGMVIHVGKFDMVLTEVSGSAGSFKGKGLLSFPYVMKIVTGVNSAAKGDASTLKASDCKGCFEVEFDGLSIDKERYVTNGNVNVITKGFNSFIEGK